MYYYIWVCFYGCEGALLVVIVVIFSNYPGQSCLPDRHENINFGPG